MTSAKMVSAEPKTQMSRIGVITAPLGTQDTPALRFLILHLNTLQQSFEFELLPGPPDDPLLTLLESKDVIKRDDAKDQMEEFVERTRRYIENQNLAIQYHGNQEVPLEPPPNKFVILTTARFDDNLYSARKPDKDPVCAIIALGNWKRNMAPPTIVEFFLVLLLRQAVALACPSLSGSIHFGTKGCLCDFNQLLSNARYQVLNGFVCNHCARALINDGYPSLKDELVKILGKEWLGSRDEPKSVVSIASNLGHSLFVMKGLKPTFWENVRSVLQQEGVKQLLTVIGTVLAAGLVFFLGFKTGKS